VRGVQQAVNEWNGKTKTHIHIHMRMYVCLIKVNTLWLENWFNKHKKKQVKRRQTERMQNFAATTKRIVIKL